MSLKITHLRLQPHLPGANGLKVVCISKFSYRKMFLCTSESIKEGLFRCKWKLVRGSVKRTERVTNLRHACRTLCENIIYLETWQVHRHSFLWATKIKNISAGYTSLISNLFIDMHAKDRQMKALIANEIIDRPHSGNIYNLTSSLLFPTIKKSHMYITAKYWANTTFNFLYCNIPLDFNVEPIINQCY